MDEWQHNCTREGRVLLIPANECCDRCGMEAPGDHYFDRLERWIGFGADNAPVSDGVAVDTAPHPLLSAPTLYGRTGDVKDCNTLLVNRGELRAALGVKASGGDPNRLYTPRDWQAEATIRAAKLTGTPEGAQALVEAKRYGVLADLIETLQKSQGALLEGITREIDWGAVDEELLQIVADARPALTAERPMIDALRALLRKVSGQ